MTTQQFITKLKATPTAIVFSETIATIDSSYNFTPTTFKNGTTINKAGENSGSCKVFAFAKLENLTKEETLFCFGEHYQNVLEDANGTSHQNIRNFMEFGFEGLAFEGISLHKKNNTSK